MATIKSYTDLQQSKKLVKILSPKSADMFYIAGKGEPVFIGNKMVAYGEDDYDCLGGPDVLCWSLAALLDVLPDTITSNDGIAFELNIKKNIVEYSNPSLYLIYKSVKSDNLIDACVAMIEKLHEL